MSASYKGASYERSDKSICLYGILSLVMCVKRDCVYNLSYYYVVHLLQNGGVYCGQVENNRVKFFRFLLEISINTINDI